MSTVSFKIANYYDKRTTSPHKGTNGTEPALGLSFQKSVALGRSMQWRTQDYSGGGLRDINIMSGLPTTCFFPSAIFSIFMYKLSWRDSDFNANNNNNVSVLNT